MLNFRKAEFGDALVIREDNEEYIEAAETYWHKNLRLIPGESLKHYREMHGLTQRQLGEKLGDIPRQQISNMENGHRTISLDMAKKLAAILNTSPVNFLDI